MMHFLLLIFVIVFSSRGVNSAQKFTPILDLPQGSLKGVENLRGDYRKYLGIPYATVPERFGDPGPAPTWEDVFEATKPLIFCSQYNDRLAFPTGQEDCLILNVFTPGQVNYKSPLPVMVYIHGGEYAHGGSTTYIYNPEPLVKKNVIVVTINYRVGAFGFLCLRVKGASGNAGLKDQIAALKWVRQNIRQFGGDPYSVTVFGESAGATSVSHLLLTPESAGLFKRAILESGTVLSPFAFSYDPIDKAAMVAANLGYNTKNPYELLRIFKNATRIDIIIASIPDNYLDLKSQFIFRPCAEKQIFGTKPLITKTPRQALESGDYNKVSTIIGYTNKEGIYYIGNYDADSLTALNDNFESILPDNLYFTSREEKTSVANQIREFYFGKLNIDKDSKDILVDYISDVLFHYPAENFTEYFVQSGLTVYNYYFKYDSYRNLGKILKDQKDMRGAAHSDELFYLFQPTVLWPVAKVKKDLNVVDKMATLWTNFARNGDPTSLTSPAVPLKWQASDDSNLKFLYINSTLSMKTVPNPQRIEFWRSIYAQYGM